MGKKSEGNVMNLVTIGITILAMSIVVTAYLEYTGLMMKKMEISQLSRKYILLMETQGYLSEQNKQALLQELEALEVRNIDLSGTTLHPVSYGETILLKIRGTISTEILKDSKEMWEGGFQKSDAIVEEYRSSTAKN